MASFSPNGQRGLFIVLEGLDRSGKSTQCELLLDRLREATSAAEPWKFPERTRPTGILLDRYLRKEIELGDRSGKAVHLLFSANRWECAAEIEALLATGTSVVCDRYAFSGLAFSMAKGLDQSFLQTPDTGLPLPDVTLFLTLSAQEAARRGSYGEERYELEAFQTLVRAKFDIVGAALNATHGPDSWVEVDAGGSVDDVRERIWELVAGRLGAGREGSLWQRAASDDGSEGESRPERTDTRHR